MGLRIGLGKNRWMSQQDSHEFREFMTGGTRGNSVGACLRPGGAEAEQATGAGRQLGKR